MGNAGAPHQPSSPSISVLLERVIVSSLSPFFPTHYTPKLKTFSLSLWLPLSLPLALSPLPLLSRASAALALSSKPPSPSPTASTHLSVSFPPRSALLEALSPWPDPERCFHLYKNHMIQCLALVSRENMF